MLQDRALGPSGSVPHGDRQPVSLQISGLIMCELLAWSFIWSCHVVTGGCATTMCDAALRV